MEAIFIILFIVAFLYSVILHEVAHGAAALYLGDSTAKYLGRLSLNPIPHIDIFGSILLPIVIWIISSGSFIFGYAKPVPFNPYNLRDQRWGPALVGLAGPMANLVLVIVAAATAKIFIEVVGIGDNNMGLMLFYKIIGLNVLLMVFNLLPIPPLDGSKLLYALPFMTMQMKLAMERWGMLILLGFLFIGGPILSFLFFFGITITQAVFGLGGEIRDYLPFSFS